MTHLFLFTLTPVQSFIAQARKTQDLWAGSHMLSDLIGKVFDKINSESGQVIFPAQKSDSLPNRILAEFDFQKTDQELKDIGKRIADEVAIELYELTKKALAKIKKEGGDVSKIEKAFEAQLKNYFSTFWVFVPFENDYQTTYDNADRLLGAVKNARTFTQYPEQGRKCSLSGEQNALVVYKSKNLPAFTYEIVKDENDKDNIIPRVAVVSNPNISEGEGLSAISYIKRFYPFHQNKDKKEFDSTADIALLHTITKLKEKQKEGSNLFLDCFAKCFNENNIDEIDGQLFFEENFTKKYFEKQNINVNLLEPAKEKLADIQRIAKKENLPFTKYYAILLFDADSMGKWLSGDFIEESKRAEQLYDFHKHISGLLSEFADYAKKYVDGKLTEEDKKKNPELKNEDLEIKKGRTVYAGGDDYLGFINLHYLFEVLKHLREQFKEQVSDKISGSGKYQIRESKEMTFSAGVAIAHYKTPLSEVLTWARKMEKEAKDTDNKDSFGMAVLKHSGEIHKAVLPFKKDSEWIVSDLDLIVTSLNSGISPKFMSSLEREMLELGLDVISDDDQASGIMTRLVGKEIKRLIERAGEKATLQTKTNLSKTIDKLLIISENNYPNLNKSLSVCDFINRKLQGND